MKGRWIKRKLKYKPQLTPCMKYGSLPGLNEKIAHGPLNLHRPK